MVDALIPHVHLPARFRNNEHEQALFGHYRQHCSHQVGCCGCQGRETIERKAKTIQLGNCVSTSESDQRGDHLMLYAPEGDMCQRTQYLGKGSWKEQTTQNRKADSNTDVV